MYKRQVGTLIPILLGVALGMSSGGSPLGAIFYILVYNIVLTLGMRFLYYKGCLLYTSRKSRMWCSWIFVCPRWTVWNARG